MTRQTLEPVDYINLSATNQSVRQLVNTIDDDLLDLAPPYQRPDVWTYDQRVALIYTLTRGLTPGIIVIANRDNEAWRKEHRVRDVTSQGYLLEAVIDGRQRLTTARLWLHSELLVPASWFSPEHVERTEETEDGPYLRFNGLSKNGQRKWTNRAFFPTAKTDVAKDLKAEADLYLLLNGGGTPQAEADMQRARDVAAR